MKKTSKVFILTLVAIPFLVLISVGQVFANKGPSFRMIVQKRPINKDFVVDSIYVRSFKPYRVLTTRASFGDSFKVDSKGELIFRLPFEEDVSTFEFWLYKDGKAIFDTPDLLFVENSDDITIDLSREKDKYILMFKGKGAEKYNLAMKLRKLREHIDGPKGTNRYVSVKKGDLTERIRKINELHEKYFEKAKGLINNSKLSDKIKALVSYGNYPAFFFWNSDMYSLYQTYKDYKSRILIRENVMRCKHTFEYSINDDLMALHPVFSGYFAVAEGNYFSIKSGMDTIRLEVFYKYLSDKYHGKFRDVMLSNLFNTGAGISKEIYRGTNPTVYDSLSIEAEKLVRLSTAKKALSDRNKTAPGSLVQNASFVNLDGSTLNLFDFKGKVIFIDFWGTGCSACARFHQWFHKEIYPMYKGNKDFVYLSINIDKTISSWKSALSSGRYSSPDYINLNADFLGVSHPFLEHYNVSAVPFLLLVGKNGRTETAAIPNEKNRLTKILNEALVKSLNYSGK